MYTSNSQHEQIYRMRSCLMIIMTAVFTVQYENYFQSEKRKTFQMARVKITNNEKDFLEGSYRCQEDEYILE